MPHAGPGELRDLAVLVRGPLGVGKTTVTERLAERIDGDRISIDRILEEHDLESWEDGYISEASFLRANDFAIEIAGRSIRRGRCAVIDGNFYWPRQVEDLERRLSVPLHTFTLRAPLELCVARDAGRSTPLGRPSAAAVYAKVTSFTAGVEIDATQPLERIVEEILGHLLA